MTHTTPHQFGLLRIVLGSCLVATWVSAWNRMRSVYVFGPISLNELVVLNSATLVMLLLSTLLLLGVRRRWMACLFGVLFGFGLVVTGDFGGYLWGPYAAIWITISFAFAAVPEGEGFSWSRKRTDAQWRLPRYVFVFLWWVLGFVYALRAVNRMMTLDLQGGGLLLAVEFLFVPLALFPRTRPWAWALLFVMQIGALFLADTGIALALLMLHLCTFDARWLGPEPRGETPPIVFFDGMCGLCNRSVDFLVCEDSSQVLRYSALQGATAREKLSIQQVEDLNTLFLWEDGHVWERSCAWIRIGELIGGVWKLTWILRVFPKLVRDRFYDFVAAHRYRIFGKLDSCRLPSPEERALFLD